MDVSKVMKLNKYSLGLIFLVTFTGHVSIAQVIEDENNSYWHISYLDAARYVSYLNENEKDIVLEINKVRTNPKLYAEQYLEPLRDYYKGTLFTYPGTDMVLKTEEGIRALNECIQELKAEKPVGLMHPSPGLSLAANNLAKEQSRNGRLGHEGRRGSTPFSRMDRHGKWLGSAAENIDYGNRTARWVLISLLVDDGVKGRGHRKNIMHEDFKKVGVAFESHPVYGHMCVMDFASDYREK